jgi:REP element-mobilizing transposase RayT
MPQQSADPGRRSLPHLPSRDPVNQSIIQYVSLNVDKRRPLLAHADTAAVLLAAWARADYWRVGRYVIMPDHLHLFCGPATIPPTPLRQWMLYWRAEATRHWPRPDEKPIWQKDFFDRQFRRGESYDQKWLYVWQNPVRAGLVTRPEDWPYQGELNVLRWDEPA